MTVHCLPTHSDGTPTLDAPADSPSRPFQALLGPYGVPVELLTRAWAIRDITAYTGLGPTRVRQLLHAADAPAPLRCGRGSLRYSAVQILAWLHGDDWRTVGTLNAPMPGSEQHASSPAGPAESAPRQVVEIRRAAVAPDDSDPDPQRRRVVRPADVAEADRARRMRSLVSDRSADSTVSTAHGRRGVA